MRATCRRVQASKGPTRRGAGGDVLKFFYHHGILCGKYAMCILSCVCVYLVLARERELCHGLANFGAVLADWWGSTATRTAAVESEGRVGVGASLASSLRRGIVLCASSRHQASLRLMRLATLLIGRCLLLAKCQPFAVNNGCWFLKKES